MRYFVAQAAAHGVDLFRVFDSLNWVENMRVAIDAVGESGRLCEAAICYTGNLDDPGETKYDLGYYVRIAKELERAGAHVLGIKDMAGLCRPRSAYRLVKALKEEIGLPVHFHTHDTSGIAAASVLMAIDAGVDAVDGALDSMSGMTSQPNLGSIVEALRFGPRDSGPRPGQAARAVQLLRAGAARLCGVRIRDARRRLRGVRARDARRPVHQPARAGALARHRRHALARGRARVRAGERDVRRHGQGDAVVEGRGRHGTSDGDERSRRRRRAGSRRRSRLPGVGRVVLPRRARAAARRISRGPAAQDPQGRDAAPRRGPAKRCRQSTWRVRARSCRRGWRVRSPTTTSRHG